jgi:hypothetical protein
MRAISIEDTYLQNYFKELTIVCKLVHKSKSAVWDTRSAEHHPAFQGTVWPRFRRHRSDCWFCRTMVIDLVLLILQRRFQASQVLLQGVLYQAIYVEKSIPSARAGTKLVFHRVPMRRY